METAFVDRISRVERVAFNIVHSCAVRFFFGTTDGNSTLAVILELFLSLNAPLEWRLPSLSMLAREHGCPGSGPIAWHRQEVDVHRLCPTRVLVGLSVELRIVLDGLECLPSER